MLLPELENYLNNPSQIKNLQPEKLWQLLKQYPYFQTARLMLARQLHDTGHEAFPLSLKLASAYAYDRNILRNLIENKIPDSKLFIQNSQQILINQEDSLNEGSTFSAIGTIETESGLPAEVATVVFNEKQLETIRLIKSRLGQIRYADETEDPDFNITENLEENAFDEIIEKFLQNNPKINAPRRDFFNPVDVAKQSSVEPDDVVTETLAWIYEKQGLNEKAIKIYEKLMLLFPEKNTYFAARIKNLGESRK